MHQLVIRQLGARPRLLAFLAVITAVLAFTAGGSGAFPSARAAGGDSADSSLPVVALHGYNVSLFARGTTAYTHPDSIVVIGDRVWIDYQNVTSKTGGDGKSSTIVEYDREAGRSVPSRSSAIPTACGSIPRPACCGRSSTRMATPRSTRSIPTP